MWIADFRGQIAEVKANGPTIHICLVASFLGFGFASEI